MGNCIRTVFRKIMRKQSARKNIVLLLLGLDNAGKSLVLNRLTGDCDENVMPTMGFRTVSLKYKSCNVKVYDLGGSPQIRPIWPKYYNDVHGLIYVVDASDISRLTENRIILGELISHEHVSGKPLLLLANKQDLNGAIDELDLVENLDVERVANAMRCPTRVETCSCFQALAKSSRSTQGIINGYKWLLNTIVKNYPLLNNRIKVEQAHINGFFERTDVSTPTPSMSSLHSNPFKPIHELLVAKESSSSAACIYNGADSKKSTLKKFFTTSKNKTAPLTLGQRMSKSQNMLHGTDCDAAVFQAKDHNLTTVLTLDPARLPSQATTSRPRPVRPFTAPQNFQRTFEQVTIIDVPGRVPL